MGGLNTKKLLRFKFHRLKTWQLLLMLVFLGFLSATLLRADHLQMVQLRDEVFAADTSGDMDKLASTLTELRNFTFSNIVINIVEENGLQKITFGTGPFYLEQTYLRAAGDAIAKAEAELAEHPDENPNGNIFLIASNTCRPIAIENGWSWNSPGYIECMTSTIDKYPVDESLGSQVLYADVPSTELYRYNYASPLWAPSFSGFIILLAIIVVLILIARILIWFFLQLALLFI